jgi:micrococcal nuclease
MRGNRANPLLRLTFQILMPAFFWLSPILAENIEGVVISISDGDSITVRTANDRNLTVRMAGIDAPENGQEFSTVSKRYLATLVAGKTVQLRPIGTDRYQRTLAEVSINGENINLRMVRAGMAWQYIKYSDDEALNK